MNKNLRLSKFTYTFRKGSKVFLYNPLLQKKLICTTKFFQKASFPLINMMESSEELNYETKILCDQGFIVKENNQTEMKLIEKFKLIRPKQRQELWFHLRTG